MNHLGKQRGGWARAAARAFGVGAAAFVTIAAAGCGAAQATEGEPQASGSWRLTSGTGPGGDVEPPHAPDITLLFDEDRLSGVAACNSYGGSFELDGDRFAVGDLSQTEMGCERPVMAAESAYLQALQRVETIRRDGDHLVLVGRSVELRFEPLPPVPTRQLRDTRWELDTVVEGEVASSALAPAATLRLHADGSLEGGTGCRAFTGRYVAAGNEIRVTDLTVDDAATAGVCPDEAIEQERAVLQVLGDRFEAEVDGDRLTLSARGGYGLVYRAP